MNERELNERLKSALDGLIGDTQPVRELVHELAAALKGAQGDLLGCDAALEGEMTRQIQQHLNQLVKLYGKALAKDDLATALGCLNSKAAIMGLSQHDRLEMGLADDGESPLAE